MMSKYLTSLSTLTLHLQLGSAEGYYNPLSLFMHYPRCIIYPYTTKVSKTLKNMRVLCLHYILILPSSVLKTIPGPLDLYYLYGLILELLDLPVQYAHQMHLKRTFLLHLNHIPISDMINIRYILFEKLYIKYIMNRH